MSLFCLGAAFGAARAIWDIRRAGRRIRRDFVLASGVVGGGLAVAVVLLCFSALHNPRGEVWHPSVGLGIAIAVGLLGGDTYEVVMERFGKALLAAIRAAANGNGKRNDDTENDS